MTMAAVWTFEAVWATSPRRCTTSVRTYGAFGRKATNAAIPSHHFAPRPPGARNNHSASSTGTAASTRLNIIQRVLARNTCPFSQGVQGCAVGADNQLMVLVEPALDARPLEDEARPDATVVLAGVSRSFGDNPALRELDLRVP